MPLLGARLQQVVVCTTVVLAGVLFWSGASDPVNVVKFVVVALGALTAGVVSVVRVATLRRLCVSGSPVVVSALAFAAAAVVSTLTSDAPRTSLVGEFGRNAGLVLYLSCVVLLLVVVRAFARQDVRALVAAILGTGAFAAGYGAFQWAGVDAVEWADTGLSPIIGSLGNPNFQSAFLGIVVPLALWAVLSRSWALPWRAACGALGVGCLVLAYASEAVQGVLAGVAGTGVVVVAWLLDRERLVRLRGLLVLTGVAVVGAVVVASGLAGVGPLASLSASTSLSARRWYWSAAVDMLRERPLTGVGLDRYGAYYRLFRPEDAASVNNYSDAAHSVPLHLLATGGVLAGLTYLAVVLSVALVVARGLRRLRGEDRLLLGGVAGAWLAYQVQSAVSIDQVALAVTHWVLAGAIVAVAGAAFREVLLPGAVVPPPPDARKRTPRPVTLHVTGPVTSTVCGLAVLVALVLAYQVLDPLRASRASRAANQALVSGDGNTAFERFTAATELAPYEDAYWLQRGQFLQQVQQDDLAAETYREALEHDPRSFDVLVAAARLAQARGDAAGVGELVAQLRRVDPRAEAPAP